MPEGHKETAARKRAERAALHHPLVVRPENLKFVIGIEERIARKLERKGLFPARVRLGEHANSPIGWVYDELEAWLATRPRGVAGSETARKGGA